MSEILQWLRYLDGHAAVRHGPGAYIYRDSCYYLTGSEIKGESGRIEADSGKVYYIPVSVSGL